MLSLHSCTVEVEERLWRNGERSCGEMRFVPISRILKSRPLNGPSRHPATVSTGEKSTGARRSEVGLLATFVRDGGRLDGQTGYALYGSGPGRDPSPKIKKLIFGAPQVRIRTVCACGVAIGPSKSVLRKPGATKALAWLPRADGTHSESASTVLWTRRTLGVPRYVRVHECGEYSARRERCARHHSSNER